MAQPTAPVAKYAGSTAFISGHYGIIDLAEEMASSLIEEITSHIDDSEDKATERLQDSAQATPGWSDYADALSVSVALGRISIEANAFGEVEQQMMNLEFGTPEEPPVPFIRMSAAPIGNYVNSYVNAEMRKDIPLA